jgi:glycosyltransferase involved in cell wall biosynthesis
MKWWLLRRTYRKARLVTALNRHVHDRLINRFGARPESIIPFRLGIPSPVEVDAVQMQQQRAKLGADSKTMVFFSARACRPLYNVKSIISGFLQTFLKEENVQLWVSTFGAHDEYLSSLKVLIADFPEKIRFVPPVSHDEMSVLISSADVVVSTPDSDGLPVTVMQSLAQGRPLIFSDLPQIRDLLVPFRHGLAIASPTPADIGAAMRELFGVGQGFGEMKDRCREKYASLPSADEEVDALVSAFRSIVEGRFH